MFIRLRQTNETRSRVLINSDLIASVEAQVDSSSLVSLTTSQTYIVEESERKIRSLLAGAGSEADSE